MAKVLDIFLIYQFLRRLVQPFNKWKAYELGVIDENGKVILPKEKRNLEQNKVWGYFDILVANLKKLLAKIPGGRTRLASFAAALLLLREHREGNVLTEDINDIEKKLIAEIKKLSKDDIGISGADKNRYPVDYDLFFENHKKIGHDSKKYEKLKKSLESVEDELLKNPENRVLLDLKKYYEKQIFNLDSSVNSRKNFFEDTLINTTASSGVIKTSENSEKTLLVKKILKKHFTKKKKCDR